MVRTSRSRSVMDASRRTSAAGGSAVRRCCSISRRVTLGASRASPAATVLTAAYSVSRGVSFSRKPLAPARNAARTYSSTSKVVRISTRVFNRSSAQICVGSRDPVEVRHPDVQERDVGPVPAYLLDRLVPVGRLADHLEVGLGGEHGREPGPYQLLVVGDHHPHRHPGISAVCRSGIRACTVNPSSVGPARTSPPWRAARSCIPAMPRPTPLACRVGAALPPEETTSRSSSPSATRTQAVTVASGAWRRAFVRAS